MTIRLSKPIIFGVSVFILVLVGSVVWKRQVVESSTKMASPSATTVVTASPSPTATPKITYAFPIRNTVTKEQRQQFKGGLIKNIFLDHNGFVEGSFHKEDEFVPFTDGEVTFLTLHYNHEQIVIDAKDRLITDKIEREQTVRLYSQKVYDHPLLRISKSSFEDVVTYEKKQLFPEKYNNQLETKSSNVIAFGHNGVELEVYSHAKLTYYNTLIVPLNGYVYVFYAINTTAANSSNVVLSSFQFVEYPE